jgi:hypothetical protein
MVKLISSSVVLMVSMKVPATYSHFAKRSSNEGSIQKALQLTVIHTFFEPHFSFGQRLLFNVA